MNWYIGQDIVAVIDQPQGDFKIGDTFVIHGISYFPCNCRDVVLDIGIRRNGQQRCLACGQSEIDTNTIMWYSENRFAPLDTLADISELTEHLENTKPFELYK